MGSLALFELEETLGQTGDTVIIQMHEIGEKSCFGCLGLRLKGKDKALLDHSVRLPRFVRAAGSDIQPIGSLELLNAPDPPEAGESEA
jgi:hypothetical protein